MRLVAGRFATVNLRLGGMQPMTESRFSDVGMSSHGKKEVVHTCSIAGIRIPGIFVSAALGYEYSAFFFK